MAFAPIWPVVGPITQFFSPTHLGLDIAVPLGTPVLIVADGVVGRVAYDTLTQQPLGTNYAGYFVEVDHAEGWRSRYLHLKPFSETVQVGQLVRCGQGIALSDTTGTATGPHLHLTLWNRAPMCAEAFYIPWTGYYACDPLALLQQPAPGVCPSPLPPREIPPPWPPPPPEPPPLPPPPGGAGVVPILLAMALGGIGFLTMGPPGILKAKKVL